LAIFEKLVYIISKNWSKIKYITPHFVIRSGINFLIWHNDRKVKKSKKEGEEILFPPAKLRFRVHGSPFIESYIGMGEEQKKDLELCLAKIGKNFSSFPNILDFGCGCGRTLTSFKDNHQCNFFGTDIDEEAIRWCQNNLKFAKFDINQSIPPSKYKSEQFDLVYAISVFTHLNEELQFLWLDELKRITKPKGILLLTLHNIDLLKPRLSKKENFSDVTKSGFVYRKGELYQGIFPDWYQNAYHSKDYVMENYSKYFKILHHIPKGMNNLHDIVLLENY
jgi:cyclopropane fatty-acyl-phospholipid synthase-like methyltransferase